MSSPKHISPDLIQVYLEISKEPLAPRPANNEAIKKRIDVTAETSTHHNITPLDNSSLLYNIHTPDPPHADPCQSSQAPSITLPIKTGPGMEPEIRKYYCKFTIMCTYRLVLCLS